MTNHNMQLLFLDWKQAFDSLDHTAMLEELKRFGLSKRMLDTIPPVFYVQGFNQAECKGHVHAGIRQGCPLSPYLFIVVLSVILADMDSDLSYQGTPTNTWSVSHSVFDLEYQKTTGQLQQFLSALETVSSEYGMRLNQDKTELLSHPRLPNPPIYFLDGSAVKTTPQVKYLGSQISWDKSFDLAFYHRLGLAEEAYKKPRLIWNSPKSRQSKVRLFKLFSYLSSFMVLTP